MTTYHQTTREEEAFWQLIKENEDTLSEAGRTVLWEADDTADAAYMVCTYAYQPEEYDEAMEKMCLAAANLSDRDYGLLEKIWRAAKAAGASIDAHDCESIAGRRVYSGDLHYYYMTVSGMIEDTLERRWHPPTGWIMSSSGKGA